MTFNIEDPAALQAVGVNIIDHFNQTTIPALEAACNRVLAQAATEASALVDRTTTELGNIMQGAAQSIQAIMDKGLAQIAAQVSRIDGASVRLSPVRLTTSGSRAASTETVVSTAPALGQES